MLVTFLPIKEATYNSNAVMFLFCAETGLARYSIDFLHIPKLILILYVFDIFLFELFPVWMIKWFPFHARASEKTNNSETGILSIPNTFSNK